MAELAFTVPILPGKKATLEEFARTLAGPRAKEFAESEKKFKTDKETWFLESTPQGDVCIVHIEAQNPMKAMEDWVASQHPFELWVKEQIKAITGIDFNNPPPGEFPKQILRYGY